MKIQEIHPFLYRIVYFEYHTKGHTRPKISHDKTQYAYHLLLIDKGALDVWVGGEVRRLKAGDVLYLLPSEVYRLLPCGEDFSLYNLFFDFLDHRSAKNVRYHACIFKNRFDADLCLPPILFEDAPILNQSGIIKNLSCENVLKPLLRIEPSDPLFLFRGYAALVALIADILNAAQKRARQPT